MAAAALRPGRRFYVLPTSDCRSRLYSGGGWMRDAWRQFAGCILLTAMLEIVGQARSQSWQAADPATVGWPVEKLESAKRTSVSLKPTAVVIVQYGKMVASWGDISRKVNVTSVRKSLLSALYVVAEGRIDLSSSLADPNIDDKTPGLTAEVKTTTVRDLLMERSGIYHPAPTGLPISSASVRSATALS
jgi:hypothetical protein